MRLSPAAEAEGKGFSRALLHVNAQADASICPAQRLPTQVKCETFYAQNKQRFVQKTQTFRVDAPSSMRVDTSGFCEVSFVQHAEVHVILSAPTFSMSGSENDITGSEMSRPESDWI
jgi:hypothetical protein